MDARGGVSESGGWDLFFSFSFFLLLFFLSLFRDLARADDDDDGVGCANFYSTLLLLLLLLLLLVLLLLLLLLYSTLMLKRGENEEFVCSECSSVPYAGALRRAYDCDLGC